MIKYEDFRNHMIHDTEEDFINYMNDCVEVISYMPIGRKYGLIDVFSTGFTYTLHDMLGDGVSSFSDMLMEYEMRKMFNIIFEYTNIEFDYKYRNNMEYDLLCQSGFYDYFMAFAAADYHRLCTELDTVVGIRDMSIIKTFNDKLNIPTPESIQKMKETVESLDIEKLKDVRKIYEMNNPLVSLITDIIKSGSASDANTKNFEVIDGGEKTIRDSETE